MTVRQTALALLVAASGLALAGRPSAAQDPACADTPTCVEVTTFVASVGDFRQSTAGSYRLVATTMTFSNKADRPLILAYVSGSGIAIDDQGNRYGVASANGVRGIGEVTGNTFDPKFVLGPGEKSDARFEFVWQPGHGAIYGTSFEIDLAIREIDPVTGNQYRLGREHALHFSGFGETVAAATGAAATTTPAAPAPPADPCEGELRCHSSGTFVAEVTRLNKSQQGPYNDQIMEVTVRFSNLSTDPLVLGYKSHSSVMVDDVGNRYLPARPGTHDTSVRGIGVVTARSADPSLQLRPGESREAVFKVWFRAGKKIVGTRYAFDFTLEQLEILPSQQLRTVREYAVGFRDLEAGAWSAGAKTESVLDALLKKVKKG